MSITTADIKQLREVTGAGILDCKKALQESDGDLDQAIEFLRKKGTVDYDFEDEYYFTMPAISNHWITEDIRMVQNSTNHGSWTKRISGQGNQLCK